MVPDRLWLHEDIKPFDIRLWCALTFFARDRDWCDPTDAVLADKLGVSIQTVQRGLKNLETAQFVQREMKGRERFLNLHPEGNGEPVAEYTLRLARSG
jgi:CTP-dependent riboflavin kinase